MKASRLTLGIISIVLFVIVSMQSCAVGVANTMLETGEFSGTAGTLLSICLLVAGIVGICVRKSLGAGPFVAGGFYVAGALFAFLMAGSYTDLYIWAFLSLAFGLTFILTNIFGRRKAN